VPNVAELIQDHVTLQVRCVDRLYLNGYVPALQSPGGVVAFLQRACGQVIPSPAGLGHLTEDFKQRLRTWAQAHAIPWIEFRKGERKDDVVERYRRHFRGTGVVLVGVAQERASGWRATKQQQGRRIHFAFSRRAVCVNHYYLYLIDEDWGPAFIKICGYAPYGLKLCLNGHEWLKRQLARRRIPYTPLDNGFRSCADPVRLQALADRLDHRAVEQFFRRWQARLPLPLGRAHRAVGFPYRLSILQMEVSLTQVFDRPQRGREFFEEVIRDHLALGRPDQIALLFARRVPRNCPSRFRTQVVSRGVRPSLHVEYKRCHVKQYFKEERALRTETTFNDTYDVGVKRGLSNFRYLRTLGDHINRRLLTLERVAHDCGLAPARLSQLVCPTQTANGQHAPALKLGDPRVMAVFQALCQFGWTIDGIRHAPLRVSVARLLGTAYGPRQMTYDLRRLCRKGLLQRVDHTQRYVLTPAGRRIVLFLTKVHTRILRPGLQAVDLTVQSQAPPLLRRAFTAVDQALTELATEARIAA
jgi:hypothetical protein